MSEERTGSSPPKRFLALRIRGRVAIAMLVPLVLALGVAVWASVASVSHTVEQREQDRIEDAGRLLHEIARTLVAAPPRSEFLRNLSLALGGELVVHDRSAAEVRSTFEGDLAEAFRSAALEGGLRERVSAGETSRLAVGDREHLVLAESMSTHDVYLVYPGDPVTEAVDRARRPLLLAGAAALLVATILAFLLASLITRPLKRLAAEAAQVAGGDLDREITVRSRDETGELAASFNRMLEGLRAYRRDLVEAERLAILGRVAGGMAHELRNPLTAIRMNVQMLPGESDPDQRQEDADLVLEEIDRLERAIDDLLAIARPEPPELASVDLTELVEATVGLLRRQLDHLGVLLTVERVGVGEPTIRADERRLRQVLLNLILNGAQAMPAGGDLRIEIETDSVRARVSVLDEGEGIPAEIEERIFEPFVSGRPGGTGLGLAVCHRIVEAHGGEIAFRRLPSGSAFDVMIPVR